MSNRTPRRKRLLRRHHKQFLRRQHLRNTLHQGERGITILESLLAMGMMVGLMAVIFTAVDMGLGSSKSVLIESAIVEHHQRVIDAIGDSRAWHVTLNHPANKGVLNCLKNRISCKNEGGEFDLLDRKGQVIIDTLKATKGFKLDGSPCDSFSAERGNNACPLKYVLQWRPICSTPGCQDPQVQIVGQIRYKPATGRIPLNLKAREFAFVRQQSTFSLQTSCEAAFGKWTGSACELGFLGGCAEANFVGGFNIYTERECGFVAAPVSQLLGGACSKKSLSGYLWNDAYEQIDCKEVAPIYSVAYPEPCQLYEYTTGFYDFSSNSSELDCQKVRDNFIQVLGDFCGSNEQEDVDACLIGKEIELLPGPQLCANNTVHTGTEKRQAACRTSEFLLYHGLTSVETARPDLREPPEFSSSAPCADDHVITVENSGEPVDLAGLKALAEMYQNHKLAAVERIEQLKRRLREKLPAAVKQAAREELARQAAKISQINWRLSDLEQRKSGKKFVCMTADQRIESKNHECDHLDVIQKFPTNVSCNPLKIILKFAKFKGCKKGEAIVGFGPQGEPFCR